jgi:hypothetical protein
VSGSTQNRGKSNEHSISSKLAAKAEAVEVVAHIHGAHAVVV